MVIKTEQHVTINHILVGRCECDSTVRFPFWWAEEIISFAKENQFEVIDLQKENFCETKFDKYVKEKSPSFIFLNGHGDEICAMGYSQNPVVTLNKNDHLLKGKIVHIISCKTALLLGQFSVDKGCKGYIGYEGLFHIKNLHPDPSLDKISRMFMEAVNETSKTLIKGGSLKEAYIKSQEIYQKHINNCKRVYFDDQLSDMERDFMHGVMTALEQNKENQIFINF